MKSDSVIDISHCRNYKQLSRKIKKLSVSYYVSPANTKIIYAKFSDNAFAQIKALDPNIIISTTKK